MKTGKRSSYGDDVAANDDAAANKENRLNQRPFYLSFEHPHRKIPRKEKQGKLLLAPIAKLCIHF
jgi:hypothetical protein